MSKRVATFSWSISMAGYLPLIALFTIGVLILLSPNRLMLDEPMHLELAGILNETGSIRVMLSADSPSATGPLYPVIHSLLKPITQFQPHLVRWINLGFVVLTWLITWRVLEIWNDTRLKPKISSDTMAFAGATLCIPTVWPASGLALTEAPTWFMAALSVWASILSLKAHSRTTIFWAVVAGLFMGLAICGRQLLLPILAMVGLAGLWIKTLRWRALVFTLTASILPVLLFIEWGGFTRPSTRDFMQGSYQWSHLAFSFGYLAFTILLIAPTWFARFWKACTLCLIVSGIIAFFLENVYYSPSKTLIKLIGIEGHEVLFGRLMASTFVALASACILSLILRAWEFRKDELMLFLILTTLVLSCVPLANTRLFSTRYYVSTLPFSLLMLQPWFKATPAYAVRFIAGATIGAVTLWGYLSWKS